MKSDETALREELARYRTWMPPGHFYSPIPDLRAVERRAKRIFEQRGLEIPSVDLNVEAQQQLGLRFLPHYRPDLYAEQPDGKRRYAARNDYFPFADAFFTDRLLREIGSRRVIEVGSGWSSALMLDVCDELRQAGQMPPQLDFIEPYPERLRSLLRPGDDRHATLWEQEVQDMPLEFFDRLEPNDLLFIDSSHVIKTGSDLWYLFFHVLPRLKVGVWVFIHDIPWPFEYPRVWVDEGRAWNEVYLLRAFLQYNHSFKIRWFPGLVLGLELRWALANVPRLVHEGGTGIWLERTA